MTQPIRVLIVEDSEDDALLMLRVLEKGGYGPEYRRVETAEAMRDALAAEAWELILCDYRMPRFDGLAALALYKEAGLDIPFILVSGAVGEEIAVSAMKAGAHDYVMKDKMARLVPAVQRELRDARLRREHKKTEEALRESNERYRHLFELESDAILLIDNETGRILEANRAAAELYGYGREELLTKRNTELSAESEETRKVTEETPIAADHVVKIPLRHHRKKDGTIFPVEITGRFFYWKDRSVHIASIRDITERKQAEQALREGEERYRILVEKSLAGVYVVQDGRFVFLNHNAASFAGYRPEELVGRPSDSILHPEDLIGTLQEARKMLREESTSPHEFRIITRDGRVRWIMEMVTSIQYNGRSAILGNSVDVTGRKLAEAELNRSQVLEKSILESVPHGLFGVEQRKIFFANDAMETVFGWKPEELIGQSTRIIFRNEREWEAYGAMLYSRLKDKPTFVFESDTPFVRKDGREIYCRMSVSRTGEELSESRRIVATFEDITERRRIEQDLRDAEQRYRSIFENAQEAIYRSTPEGKIILANPAMARMFGYDSPEELVAGIHDIARQHYAHPEERERIKEQIERHGSAANIETQHCRRDGSLFWVSMTMQAIRDEKGRLLYYEGIDEDITDRKESLERLRKALGGTIQAISMAVETKDPYTAGHQRRTADLARAIATEMGLDADQRDFIRIAATIHDIGKIALPAEILSKPTKLTDIEFSLIKTHALQGYEILKDIEFPWPVADVVLQHHERIDGSGYPDGLKGEDILPAARILSVADVVEAIASNRPYRPANGIDDALAEISKNRGILYDADAVDACLTLFREKMYHLS
jgi:PAS domain S-box-containing protein/putative nucleotidyltransferase with HDIG domain